MYEMSAQSHTAAVIVKEKPMRSDLCRASADTGYRLISTYTSNDFTPTSPSKSLVTVSPNVFGAEPDCWTEM